MPRTKAHPPDLDAAPATLVELFNGPLKGVAFPGVDGTVLQSLVEEVQRASASVDSATQSLEAARAQLEERRRSLIEKVQLAVAYARVYAKDDPELGAKLDGLAAPKRTSSTVGALETASAQPPTHTLTRRRRTAAPLATETSRNGRTEPLPECLDAE